MARYGQWRKLIGDTERPDLLDAGKKLLGYLDEQRRISGVKTQAAQRQLPDGSIVRARFDYDIPVIEVMAAPTGRRPERPDGIKGFLFEPSDTAGTFPDVVLTPFDEGAWRARVYDSSYQPDPPPDKTGIYSKTPSGLPLFPEGVPSYGNVDWRNADETLSVSWVGPTARYFGFGQTRCYVFCHGQVLLDTRTVAPDLLGLADPTVIGACLRQHPDHEGDEDSGLWLYVMVQYQPSLAMRNHYLLRFPLDRYPFDRRVPRSPRVEQEPRLQVGPGQVLLTVALPTADYPLSVHPWMFNQSGTAAKRIGLKFGGTYALEQTIDLLDPSGALYSEQLTPLGNTARITSLHDLSLQYHYPFGTQTHTDPDGIVSVTDLDLFEGLGQAVDTAALKYSVSETPSVDEAVIAVDWRNDTPVYAYGLPADRNELREYEISGTCSANIVSHGTWLDFPGGTEVVTNDVYTRDESATSLLTNAVTAVRQGLVLDWLPDPIVAASLRTATYNTSHAITIDKVANTKTHTVTANGLAVDTTQDLFVWWLDLRNQFVSYSLRELTITTTTDASGSGSGAADTAGISLPNTATIETVRTQRQCVQKGLEVLAEETITLASSTVVGSGAYNTQDVIWTLPLTGEPNTNFYEIGPFLNASTDGFRDLMDRIDWLPTAEPDTASPKTGTDTAPESSSAVTGSPSVRTPDEFVAPLEWSRVTVSLPDATTMRTYGGWQTFENHWCFSQGWPDALGVARWKNETSAGPLADATARPEVDHFIPISILPPVVVPRP